VICTPTKYYCDDQINNNEMGGVLSKYGGGDVHTGFWWENLRERGQLEDAGVDGRIILKWSCKSDVGTTWRFSPTSRDSSVGVATMLRTG
jgi:hypothetical protein